jgi:DNA-binding transcriptional regulator LsrR (DeoR family)
MSLLHEPPEKSPTEGQSKRELANNALANQALTLQLSGLTQRQIAEKLGVNQSKVKRLLNNLGGA